MSLSNSYCVFSYLYIVIKHRLLDSEREPIYDAAAVYFVMPSSSNIQRICQDCKAQLYENYHFNFITPLSRDKLEQLAKTAVEANCVAQISKVLINAHLHVSIVGPNM